MVPAIHPFTTDLISLNVWVFAFMCVDKLPQNEMLEQRSLLLRAGVGADVRQYVGTVVWQQTTP